MKVKRKFRVLASASIDVTRKISCIQKEVEKLFVSQKLKNEKKFDFFSEKTGKELFSENPLINIAVRSSYPSTLPWPQGIQLLAPRLLL